MDFCAESQFSKNIRPSSRGRTPFVVSITLADSSARVKLALSTGRHSLARNGFRYRWERGPKLKSPHSCRTLIRIHPMVSVAQPVEHRSVEPRVVGSNPIAHPNYRKLTINNLFSDRAASWPQVLRILRLTLFEHAVA
jgi:hypothetical protein